VHQANERGLEGVQPWPEGRDVKLVSSARQRWMPDP